MRRVAREGCTVVASVILAVNVYAQTNDVAFGGVGQRGDGQGRLDGEASKEALAESIVTQREVSSGRSFDPAYRVSLKQDLATLPVGKLESLERAHGDWNVGALLPGVEPEQPGAAAAELVYTPVAPCRVFDTRFGGGPIAGGTQRNFIVAGSSGFAAQGGNPAGCGVPFGPATSVMINFAVVNMAGPGNLRAWAVASPQPPAPTAAVMNFGVVAGLPVLANGIAVPICNSSAGSCSSGDLRLQVDVSATDVIGDVVGYFRSFNFAATVLQSGQTVFGTIGARYNVPSSGEVAANASLPIQAPLALDNAHIQIAGVDGTPAECPGSATAPSAQPGFVCMYPFFTQNATMNGGFSWGGTTSRYGFQVSWNATAAAPTVFFASWAYTAP